MNKNICKNVNLAGQGRKKPTDQIPFLHSPSLCYLSPELTAMFLSLGKAMSYGRKDRGPVRVRDYKTARNRILFKLVKDHLEDS